MDKVKKLTKRQVSKEDRAWMLTAPEVENAIWELDRDLHAGHADHLYVLWQEIVRLKKLIPDESSEKGQQT